MHPGARSAIPAPFAALATTPDADPKQGRPGAGACYNIRGRLLPPDTPQPSHCRIPTTTAMAEACCLRIFPGRRRKKRRATCHAPDAANGNRCREDGDHSSILRTETK